MMTINMRNLDESKITTALEEAQKRCTVRTLDYDDVKKALTLVDENCPVHAKSKRAGIRFSIDPNGQKFPNAYMKKGRPQSTIINGQFTRSGLKIEFVRVDTRGSSTPTYGSFTQEQAMEILRQAGCDTYGLQKAVNLYENHTGRTVTA